MTYDHENTCCFYETLLHTSIHVDTISSVRHFNSLVRLAMRMMRSALATGFPICACKRVST